MTDVIDNMVNLAKMIANIGSNNCIQNDKPLKLNYQSFEVSDIIPFADSVHQITHIKSSDDDLSRFSSDDSFFKQEKSKKESDDFFSKVHSILHKGEKNNKTRNNNNNLKKDYLADIFEDKNFNEKKFYKSAEKNFRRGDKKVPRNLIPFWDNRTIVDCDKKQDYNCSLNENSKINFVQLRKSQDFLWNGKRKNNKSNKKQSTQNVLICTCSSSKNFYQPTHSLNGNLEISKNVEIFCREARRPSSLLNLEKESKKMKNTINYANNLKNEDSNHSKLHQKNLKQNKSIHENNNLNKLHQKNLKQNKSIHENNNLNKLHQKNLLQNKSIHENNNQNKSHQNNSMHENSNLNSLHQKDSIHETSNNNKSHQNNLAQNKFIQNDSTRDNSNQNNSIKVITKSKKKKIIKINDPITSFDKFESNDLFKEEEEIHNNNSKNNELCLEEEEEEDEIHNNNSKNNELCLEEEEEDQMHTYKYRNVKKMKINMNQLSDHFDPILEKLAFDDKIDKEEKKDFDPIVTNVNDQNIHDPRFYFKGHQKNKKLDELCTFDISEVPNKLFHRMRNPIIQNPNEFYIDESVIDNF